MGLMAAPFAHSLLSPKDPRWAQINTRQDAEDATRNRVASVAERLDRGVKLSRSAAELRRAAWEALHGRPSA
jgi:hypothetical protein